MCSKDSEEASTEEAQHTREVVEAMTERKKPDSAGLTGAPRVFPVKATGGTIGHFKSEPISHSSKDFHPAEDAPSCTTKYFYLIDSVICKVTTCWEKNK